MQTRSLFNSVFASIAKSTGLKSRSKLLPQVSQLRSYSTDPRMAPLPQVKEILVDDRDGIRTITLDRPQKKNSLSLKMYEAFRDIINQSSKDDSTRIIVVTGKGDYFSSGNDLGNFMVAAQEGKDPQVMMKEIRNLIESFIGSLIDCRKPVIALVNGHCIGIGTTMLGMCDLVLASEKATFYAPFTSLGIVLECASSYVFPKMMGNAKANDLLLFNSKWTAEEAYRNNLVTSVFPQERFEEESWKRVQSYAKLPINSIMHSKELVRSIDRDEMHKANKKEWDRLEERFFSDECMEAVAEFFATKSKI